MDRYLSLQRLLLCRKEYNQFMLLAFFLARLASTYEPLEWYLGIKRFESALFVLKTSWVLCGCTEQRPSRPRATRISGTPAARSRASSTGSEAVHSHRSATPRPSSATCAGRVRIPSGSTSSSRTRQSWPGSRHRTRTRSHCAAATVFQACYSCLSETVRSAVIQYGQEEEHDYPTT